MTATDKGMLYGIGACAAVGMEYFLVTAIPGAVFDKLPIVVQLCVIGWMGIFAGVAKTFVVFGSLGDGPE